MKKIMFLFFLFFTANILSANSPLNIYDALKKARELNRPIFYIVASSSCSHCHKYISGAVVDNLAQLHKNYIVATCDVGKGEQVYPLLPFSGMVPTTYFLFPNGKLATEPIQGEISTMRLSQMLKEFSKYFSKKNKTQIKEKQK